MNLSINLNQSIYLSISINLDHMYEVEVKKQQKKVDEAKSGLLRAVGLDNLLVVATKTKLRSLAGRPFLVDTGDSQLDTDLSGLRRVLSGYREEMLYPVSWKAE